jgi:hypothetical protein
MAMETLLNQKQTFHCVAVGTLQPSHSAMVRIALLVSQISSASPDQKSRFTIQDLPNLQP